MKKILKTFFILIIAIISLSPFLAGTIYYIDGSRGNDGNNGLTLQSAWKTLSKANVTLVAGDTVYIREGTYGSADDYIIPANSGAAGNYITYARYQSETVIFQGARYGADLRGKSYIKIDGFRFIDTIGYWIFMRTPLRSEHNIIQNCYFSDMQNNSWAGVWLGWDAEPGGQCNYNQILNSEFHAVCHPQNIIQFNRSACYNLIEGNRFYGGPHEAIGFYAGDEQLGDIKYNIIRNNYIENRWHTGLNIYSHSERNLIENNVIVDCGEDHLNNLCGSDRDRNNPDWVHGAIQIGGPRNIIRRNVIINCGDLSLNHYSPTEAWAADSSQTYIYHNTFTANHKGLYVTTSGPMGGCFIKNNIFFNELEYEIQWDVQGTARDNYFINNNISGAQISYYPVGTQSLAYFQSTYPDYCRGNVQLNPLFVN